MPRPLWLAPITLLIGCGGYRSAAPLAWTEEGHSPSVTPAVSSYALLALDVAASLEPLDALTDTIVGGDRFRCVLSRIDALSTEGRVGPISGARVALAYAGSLVGFKRLPACYAYKKGGGSETARTGTGHQRSLCNPNGTSVANITIREATLERVKGASIEERACAINTLAHERSHGVIRESVGDNVMVFTDEGHDRQPNPVVSYVIGAVAQCVFLEAQYSARAFDVRSCIEDVGTNSFDPGSCTPEWSKQFLKAVAPTVCK